MTRLTFKRRFPTLIMILFLSYRSIHFTVVKSRFLSKKKKKSTDLQWFVVLKMKTVTSTNRRLFQCSIYDNDWMRKKLYENNIFCPNPLSKISRSALEFPFSTRARLNKTDFVSVKIYVGFRQTNSDRNNFSPTPSLPAHHSVILSRKNHRAFMSNTQIRPPRITVV